MAICCWPRALRTMSSPLESGAYRNVRPRSPGLSAPMVATRDFSGLESSDCALARAAASAAIDSLDRCMGGLRLEEIEANRTGFRAAGADPVSDRLPGIFGKEGLEFGLRLLVLDVGLSGPAEGAGEFGPAVRGTHIDHPDGLDAGSGRLDPEQSRRFAAVDTPPEFFLGRQKQVLIERVGRDGDLDPLAASRDDRKYRELHVADPHIVLKLGHVLFGRRLLGKGPRQHEFGLEHGSGLRNDAVEGRPHPPDHWMTNAALDILEGLAGIALEPMPIEGLGDDPELNDQAS